MKRLFPLGRMQEVPFLDIFWADCFTHNALERKGVYRIP